MSTLASMLLVLGSAITLGQDPADKRQFVAPHILEAVGKAIDLPAPAGLTPGEQKRYAAQTEWLKSVRARIEPPAASDIKVPRDPATGQASGRRMHGPGPVSKEWGRLQQTFEQEAHQFDDLTGALKARHDMAMAAIRNLKG